jgi:predicted nuclease of predicted toxin-antitoxin system
MDRSADTEIIARAVVEFRTVVTADLDYPRLLALTGATGPSLILFRGVDWSEAEVTARISEILAGLSEADLAQSILVIERNRMRRRRLPIA